ncbi:MAG TPA: hypothetical protein ENK26_08880 [Gammaproteobacteria bacterium]|nr:hypothetical protein [Gammaproteobacteria bacterium]
MVKTLPASSRLRLTGIAGDGLSSFCSPASGVRRLPSWGGLYMPHPQGIVMNNARVGENCDLYGSVVLINYFGQGVRIGDHCKLGNGCRILGGVELGAHTKVAPGAVVFESFPDGWVTLWGNPAVVKRYRKPPEIQL